MKQRLKILSGPLFGALAFVLMGGLQEATPLAMMAGVAVWIALWWITEAVNIFFTSLLNEFKRKNNLSDYRNHNSNYYCCIGIFFDIKVGVEQVRF